MHDIKGFEGLYAVTENGKVWSHPKKWVGGEHSGKWLKLSIVSGGYSHVTLQNNLMPVNLLVHRLVASTYLPNPQNLPQVNHKNGIKTDNRLENLEWVTAQENQIHASKNGLMITGVAHHQAKLDPQKVRDIRKNVRYGTREGVRYFARKYGVDKKTISNVLNNKIWVRV